MKVRHAPHPRCQRKAAFLSRAGIAVPCGLLREPPGSLGSKLPLAFGSCTVSPRSFCVLASEGATHHLFLYLGVAGW